MTNVNLLKNYSKSLADIYKLGEIAEEIITLHKKPVAKGSWQKKFVITFAASLALFAVVAGVVIKVLDPFAKPVPQAVVEPPPPPPRPELVAAPPGYVQVQVIEFDTGNGVPAGEPGVLPAIEVLPSIANPLLNEEPALNFYEAIEVAPDVTKALPLPADIKPALAPGQKPEQAPAPQAPPPAKPAPAPAVAPAAKPAPKPAEKPVEPMVPPLYSVNVNSVSRAEFNILNALAVESAARAHILKEYTINEPEWVVYQPQEGTGLFVAEIEVSPIRSFKTRADALAFAESLGKDAVLRMEDNISTIYDVSVCCMELDDAKIYAQRSGITDKLFKLRRE